MSTECTCALIRSANYIDGPAEWEQDPWCPEHPDLVAIKADRDGILADRNRIAREVADAHDDAESARREAEKASGDLGEMTMQRDLFQTNLCELLDAVLGEDSYDPDDLDRVTARAVKFLRGVR